MNSQENVTMTRFRIISLFLLAFSGCSDDGSLTSEPFTFEVITMDCMDLVSKGGMMQEVIRTQAEFDSLWHKRFVAPLDEFWTRNYDSVLASVKQKNPGHTDVEYEEMVRKSFYSSLPFRGTEGCTQPQIDFERYTLLGMSANASGCRTPDYAIDVTCNDAQRKITFKLHVTEHGSCERYFAHNVWALVPQTFATYNVVFEREDTFEEK